MLLRCEKHGNTAVSSHIKINILENLLKAIIIKLLRVFSSTLTPLRARYDIGI